MAAVGTPVVVVACGAVAVDSGAVEACEGAEADSVVAEASAVVVSAAAGFEAASTAALDSVGDLEFSRSTDITAAMDITIPSFTTPTITILLLIHMPVLLIHMPVRIPLPATVLAHQA